MIIGRRAFAAGALAGAAFVGTASRAAAQAFPNKPIRWIVPFPPGGNYDVTSRLVGEAMGRHLGQPVVLDNRPGAGGMVGAEAAAQQPADGYTVVMGSFSVLHIGPMMARKPSMIPLFTPLSILTTVPMVIVTRSDSRFPDWKSLLAEARARPGTVSMGHAGNGTSNHVDILRIQVNEQVTFNVVPYRGSAPGLTDLTGGQIDTYVDQLTTSLPHIKAGKFRALAVFGLERAREIPDVPTLQEAGSTGFDGGTTAGLFVRAGTPAPTVATLNGGVVAGLNDPTVRQRLAELGATVRPTTSEAFAEYLKNEEVAVQKLADMGLLKPEG